MNRTSTPSSKRTLGGVLSLDIHLNAEAPETKRRGLARLGCPLIKLRTAVALQSTPPNTYEILCR
jgi:hypothetical protein